MWRGKWAFLKRRESACCSLLSRNVFRLSAKVWGLRCEMFCFWFKYEIPLKSFEFWVENLLQAFLVVRLAKKTPCKGLAFVGYMLLTCTERKENGRDYGQLKPTLCRSAGVTKSGQECSPRLILSMRTNSAASTYYVQWIINARASMSRLSWLAG